MTNELTTEEIREYTERAATRIGFVLKDNGRDLLYRRAGAWHSFDPAHNDADSRRLARTLRIDVLYCANSVAAYVGDDTEFRQLFPPNATDEQIGVAERLAVLRVAGAE